MSRDRDRGAGSRRVAGHAWQVARVTCHGNTRATVTRQRMTCHALTRVASPGGAGRVRPRRGAPEALGQARTRACGSRGTSVSGERCVGRRDTSVKTREERQAQGRRAEIEENALQLCVCVHTYACTPQDYGQLTLTRNNTFPRPPREGGHSRTRSRGAAGLASHASSRGAGTQLSLGGVEDRRRCLCQHGCLSPGAHAAHLPKGLFTPQPGPASSADPCAATAHTALTKGFCASEILPSCETRFFARALFARRCM